MSAVASPLPSFVSPDYRPTGPLRPGRCYHPRCSASATVELTSTAGPEFGALRPCDPSQVVVRRPCCGRHARLALRDGDAFGPAPRGLAEVFARGDEEVGL